MEPKIYSEEQLNEFCKQYQKILRIEDWKIRVSLIDQEDMEGSDGKVSRSSETKQAYIRIPSAETWGKSFHFGEQNMRATLIHELLHVVFNFCEPEYPEDDARLALWELSIDSIANAFDTLLNVVDAFNVVAQAAKEQGGDAAEKDVSGGEPEQDVGEQPEGGETPSEGPE